MPSNATWYTKDLIERNEQRRRLTKQLAQLVNDVATIIAENAEPGKVVEIEGVGTYSVSPYITHLGEHNLLWVSDSKTSSARVFVSREPGSIIKMDGTALTLQVASKDEYLNFANNLHAIINAFETDADTAISALHEGFAKLRQAAYE